MLGRALLIVGLIAAIVTVGGLLSSVAPAGDGAVLPRPTSVVKGAGSIGRVVARYRTLLGSDNGGVPTVATLFKGV